MLKSRPTLSDHGQPHDVLENQNRVKNIYLSVPYHVAQFQLLLRGLDQPDDDLQVDDGVQDIYVVVEVQVTAHADD